jgi:hypothetical protein
MSSPRLPPLLIEYQARHWLRVTFLWAHLWTDLPMNDDLKSLLHEAKARYDSDPSDYMATGDLSGLVKDVVTVFGAAGGLGAVAAILKAFFSRHKGMTVKFGEDGQVVQVDGLSVDEIIRLLKACDQGSGEPPALPAEIPVKTDEVAG